MIINQQSVKHGITPSGTLNITSNNVYDVTNYASANVNVSGGGGGDTYTATISGGYFLCRSYPDWEDYEATQVEAVAETMVAFFNTSSDSLYAFGDETSDEYEVIDISRQGLDLYYIYMPPENVTIRANE